MVKKLAPTYLLDYTNTAYDSKATLIPYFHTVLGVNCHVKSSEKLHETCNEYYIYNALVTRFSTYWQVKPR
jgi:hypothetical protein